MKVLSHISSKEFLLHNYYQDEDTLDIVRKLLVSAEANKTFEDDINSYKTLLRVYDSFMENGPFSKKGELSTEFQKFFESCSYREQLFCEVIEELRKVLKCGTYGQFMMNLYMVNLLLSEKNIDLLMDSLDASNDDYALAESIFNIHDKNIEDYLTKKLDDKFGHHPVRPDGESKQKSSIKQLFDYDKFRNVVLDVISHHPQTHKDLNDFHSQPRIHTDNYVCSFFYMTSGEPYDLQKISSCINNEECYYRFLLSMTLRDSVDKKFQDLMPESVRQKLLCTAENEIIKSRPNCFPPKAVLSLLIEDKLHLHYEQVEKLLPISNFRKNEKTLFEYISALAESEGKKKQLLEYIKAYIGNYQNNEDLYVLWACFIINNDQALLFSSIFDWMQNCDNQWCHLQILEAFWSKDKGKKLVKYRFSSLIEDDKISILRIIEKSKDSNDESWITCQLVDWQKYKDYNKKAVIQFLLYRGEMSVLKYIVQNFNLEYLKMDYSYNYGNPDATDWILILFKKELENSQIAPSCYNSLKHSLVNISLNDKSKREQILKKLDDYASDNRGWLQDEIDKIKETLYKSDDENMSFSDVLVKVPLIEEFG